MQKYQYVLKSYVDADGNVLETDNSDAEKFDMTSLLRRSDDFDEEVSVYGVETDSAYVKLKDMDSLKDNEVYISDSFADKYGIKPGDTIKLDAQYEKKTYKFKVKGTYDKSQSIAVFMPIEHFADTFDFADGRFSGFLSDTKIKDIDESNIATTITIRDITKMADQLDHSMGSYMQYFQVLCILLSAVMIYLLTKLIIEKNRDSHIYDQDFRLRQQRNCRSLSGLNIHRGGYIRYYQRSTWCKGDGHCMAHNASDLQRMVFIPYDTCRLCKDVCVCAHRLPDSDSI